jgi:hypothetical protein
VSIARQLWFRRNDHLHEGTFTHPDMLVRKAYNALADYEEASSSIKGLVQMEGIEKVCWKAPPQGMYKANWDAYVNSQCDCYKLMCDSS